ncbi:electron transfer flavoprotein subunit beta/FixA family protein [Tersicoccus solisilvae]|uniref:electron transfer flavoprotein subunit beta/FixA family protein n=1 Tax=Tersicoccus solisilvae TaxID=1882339 RepID=UPI001663D874|nr:electron transfer flavoprotein subunit beta/FixA family protein [Tersicoccus solisilvae]
MRILVLVKYVPDTQFPRRLSGDGHTLARGESILSELDEYALEAAVRIREAAADPQSVHIAALTMGPADAVSALRKALQLGADEAYHLADDALAGSDAAATSRALAALVAHVGGADLVLCGMASTDGETSLVPAQLAERLSLAQVTFAASLQIADGTVRATRNGATDAESVEAPLPALVSVTDQANDPRYPNFKAIMAAKKKPVTTLSLADVGLEPAAVGAAGSWTRVLAATERPARTAGTVITDEGNAGVKLVDFLAERRLL